MKNTLFFASLLFVVSCSQKVLHPRPLLLIPKNRFWKKLNNNPILEVLKPKAIHWSFRDYYIGKFSTNLLKKATFTNSATTLDFTYQFDSNNRVSKMIIERKSSNFSPSDGTIKCTFSY